MTRLPKETDLQLRAFLETHLEINKDFTTFCAIKEDGIARQWGSAIIGLLPAWYGGGAIATRANLVGTIPRLAVRSFTYTALLMPALFVTSIYNGQCLKTHPRGPRLKFVMHQIIRYNNDMIRRSEDQQKQMQESIKIWTDLSKKSPIYRNQKELSEWIKAGGEVTKYLSRAYENASPEECYEAISRLEKFYIIPAINKVYGVQLRDEIDLNLWLQSKNAEDGFFESVRELKWSLRVPENAEEFLDWFQDDKTGKPVRNQDGAENGLTKKSVDSASQSQALARETSPPKKEKLRRKRKEIIESEQEKRL